MTILDIGGGRHPTIPYAERPPQTTYIGLDADEAEFDAASTNAYDRTIVADAATNIPDLAGRVDLAVSWQVFEHVGSLDAVLHNTHGYLKPDGVLVSLFSGRWAAFAVLNRMLPSSIGVPAVSRIARRKARNKPVFPAHYDCCSYIAVRRLTAEWQCAEIVPLYRGAMYFSFARPLMRAYLLYENAIDRLRWRNGATHYLLVAQK